MKSVLLLALAALSLPAFGQSSMQDLAIPTAPAVILLDDAATNVETPQNVKALTTSLLNGLGENISVEVTPYFFVEKNKNYYNYNNFYVAGEGAARRLEYRGFFSGNVWSNLSVSLASVHKDSVRHLALGVRMNLIRLASKRYKEEFIAANLLFEGKIRQMELDLDPDELAKSEPYKKLLREYDAALDSLESKKPLFAVDAAAAYSHFFDNTTYSEGRTGKVAAWMTVSLNMPLEQDIKEHNNYISLYAMGRYLHDQTVYDAASSAFTGKDYFDVGGKAELNLDHFSVGYEYLRRDGKDNYRSVGTIAFTLFDQLRLSGGFGKNFERTDDLVTFLGISWGFDFRNAFTR
jgi:hypothetical protein